MLTLSIKGNFLPMLRAQPFNSAMSPNVSILFLISASAR